MTFSGGLQNFRCLKYKESHLEPNVEIECLTVGKILWAEFNRTFVIRLTKLTGSPACSSASSSSLDADLSPPFLTNQRNGCNRVFKSDTQASDQ